VNVNTVKENLATALKAVTLFDNRCYGYIPDKITPPACFVDLDEWHPDAFGGYDEASFNVLVVGNAANRQKAQEQLYALCGTTTASTHLSAAVDADSTLSGAVSWAKVTRIGAVQMVGFDGVEYPAVEVTVEVAG
jgi:hypothetical protein